MPKPPTPRPRLAAKARIRIRRRRIDLDAEYVPGESENELLPLTPQLPTPLISQLRQQPQTPQVLDSDDEPLISASSTRRRKFCSASVPSRGPLHYTTTQRAASTTPTPRLPGDQKLSYCNAASQTSAPSGGDVLPMENTESLQRRIRNLSADLMEEIDCNAAVRKGLAAEQQRYSELEIDNARLREQVADFEKYSEFVARVREGMGELDAGGGL